MELELYFYIFGRVVTVPDFPFESFKKIFKQFQCTDEMKISLVHGLGN